MSFYRTGFVGILGMIFCSFIVMIFCVSVLLHRVRNLYHMFKNLVGQCNIYSHSEYTVIQNLSLISNFTQLQY